MWAIHSQMMWLLGAHLAARAGASVMSHYTGEDAGSVPMEPTRPLRERRPYGAMSQTGNARPSLRHTRSPPRGEHDRQREVFLIEATMGKDD